MNNTIGIGVLSWKAHETLIKSLDSYHNNGFLSLFDQKIIYFSDMCEGDKSIASRYGWNYTGGSNAGIAAGMKHLAEQMDTDYILLLQNDNPIIEDEDFAKKHIIEAVKMMNEGHADLARMRHRWKVGEGFADVVKYLRYFKPHHIASEFDCQEHCCDMADFDVLGRMFNRTFKPHNMDRFKGRSVFIEENPEEIHSDFIKKQGNFYVIDSAAIDFTDQCLLISKKLWLDVFIPFVEANPSCRKPNGFQAPETCINGSWWRNKHFKVLQGRGLFTHARYDGSFRTEHWTQQKNKKTA